MPTPTELIAIMARDRSRISKKLDGNYANARSRKINIWNAVLTTEIETGSMFLVAMPEQTPYLCVGLTRETLYIPRAGKGGDRFWAYVNRRYGISERDDITKFVLDNFRTYALQNGAKVELRRFAAYQTDEKTVYISRYNGSQWRIDGTEIMPIANGEEDIFFVDDDGGRPIEPEVGPNGVLLDKLIEPISFAESGMGGITSEQMKMAYIVWIFALAFPDLMPTKPILIVEGAPGAGKSAALNLLQRTLFGESKPIILSRDQSNDFGVLLLRNPICLFDNLDAYFEWVPDAVSAYTTAGKWTKRRLYTDAEEMILKPHAFIAVASKNPASFRREDVADRAIILRLERRVEFTRFQALEQEVDRLRPQLVGEFLYYVNQIVAAIRDGALALVENESHRMADFAAIARIVGRVLQWEDDAVIEMLEAIRSEQAAFWNEEDPLADLLQKWITFRPRGQPSNIGREIPLFTLYQELESIAQANGMAFYKGARQLAQKLRAPHLERDFIVQMIAPDGHKSYRIWRRSDAQLSTVPATPIAIVQGNDE